MYGEQRDQIVKFRMTINEKKALQRRAKTYQMNVSEYIRHVTAKPPKVTRDEFDTTIQKTIYEIHKIGTNINQIAKKYNEHQYVEPSQIVLHQLSEVYDLMQVLTNYLNQDNR